MFSRMSNIPSVLRAATISTFTAAMIGAVALTAACGDGGVELTTPRSELPEPLVGDWFTGTLSSIQYYDRDTGEWQDPSGEGFYYVFSPDGEYETGAIIDSTVSGCHMRLLGNEFGTVTTDGPFADAGTLTVYRHQIKVNVTSSCGNSGERTQGEAVSTLDWSIAPDENGLEWLTLEHADGSVEQYHRWE